MLLNGLHCPGHQILCSQPRKIAAVSLAERVTLEYAAGNQKHAIVGHMVGYRVGSKRKAKPYTRIEYLTEGTLLQLLGRQQKAAEQLLKRCGAIIVDEAHERNISTDLLIGLLKSSADRWPHLKVVVTSATLDTAQFSRYLHDCPVVEIPGRTFPVEVHYKQSPAGLSDDIRDRTVNQAVEIVLTTPSHAGDILCFLTGQQEVHHQRMMRSEIGLF